MNGLRLKCTLHSLGLVLTGYLRLWFQLQLEKCWDSLSFSLLIQNPFCPMEQPHANQAGDSRAVLERKWEIMLFHFCFHFKMELKLNLKLNINLKKLFGVDWAILIKTELFHVRRNLSELEKKIVNFQTEHVKMRELNLIQTLRFKFLLNKICQNDTFYI